MPFECIPGLDVRKSRENGRFVGVRTKDSQESQKDMPPAGTGKGIQMLTMQVNNGRAEKKYTPTLKLL